MTKNVEKTHYGEKIRQCKTCFNEEICKAITDKSKLILDKVESTGCDVLINLMQHYLGNLIEGICVSEDPCFKDKAYSKKDLLETFNHLERQNWEIIARNEKIVQKLEDNKHAFGKKVLDLLNSIG